MRDLLDAFWRATAYCLHPRVIALSVLPLVVAAGLIWLLGWLYWEPVIDGVRDALQSGSLTAAFMRWLDAIGWGGLRSVLPILIVVALAVPLVVVLSLLLVAWMMTPALTSLVARRRFPALQRREGGSWWAGLAWSLGCTVLALGLLVVSVPLWFIPPLVLVLPPLIWGWLTTRVMAYDVLADHADADERGRLMRRHRWPLLAIGIITGYLGAAPSLIWAAGAATLVLAPLLLVASVWIYTLVFAFSALWFAHYALAALQQLRRDDNVVDAVTPPAGAPALPSHP